MRSLAPLLAVLLLAGHAAEDQAISYRLSFPEPQHRWMQVEITFPGLGNAPLQIRMSRSSPGRYAVHEFAKNVYDVQIADGAGKTLVPDRPNPSDWNVRGHDGTVRILYKVYGDRVDGTYLAVDTTHAHMNMPATLMWAKGLEDRPATIRLEPPAGARWTVATQLYATADPLTFTAPNLQYLMDSPTEFGEIAMRTFTIGGRTGAGSTPPTFRVALHHEGTPADLDALLPDVEQIVREERAVFGEFPEFEPGSYTFIADYLSYASGDGMEHRNSTILSSKRSVRDADGRRGLLGTVAHEFFHAWNVERIRPRSLEPFDFERANVSGELWLAEGFTSYYGDLVIRRTGLASLSDTLQGFAGAINEVTFSPGRQFRSAVEMSRHAPFVDAATSIDRTNFSNTFISYYTWGEAIALGLDLTLRDRSAGKVTLDDYMRAMWRVHGKPGGRRPGLVDAPYTLDEARARLAEVSGDRAFADDFFRRYIEGREVVDYRAQLARAGLVLRRQSPGRASIGFVQLDSSGGASTVSALVPFGSPAYEAGLDQDDRVVSFDGQKVSTRDQLGEILKRHKPGDRVPIVFLRRGAEMQSIVTLEEDPRLELVTIESTGAVLGEAERAFRSAWLGRKAGD